MPKLSPRGQDELDRLVAKLISQQNIPGFAFGATTADEELYFNTGGYRIVNDPTSGKVGPDTVFWICSMTKMIAHIAALQLIEQEKMTFDTPVSEFFPQFSSVVIVSDTSPYIPAKTVMTVQHLLNFSSGLYYSSIPNSSTSTSQYTVPYSAPHNMQDPHTDFFRLLQGDYPGIPVKFEPGTDFVYGFSSDVLGFIVEKITGNTLEAYFKENIFKPLGIKGSFYLTPDMKQDFLTLSLRTPGGGLEPIFEPKWIERDPTKVSRLMSGLGLYMSLRDYLKLLQHILQIQSGKATNPILSAESARSMFVGSLTERGRASLDLLLAPRVAGNSWSTALAVSSVDAATGRQKGSAFWSGWAGTYFFIDPATGIAAVFGTQITGTTIGTRDPENVQAFITFEKILYEGLSSD